MAKQKVETVYGPDGQVMVAQKKKKSIWPWIIGGILVIGGCNAILNPQKTTTTTTQTETVAGEQFPQLSFAAAAEKYFSPTVLDTTSFTSGTGTILFKQNADYFETGDKINKVMAIESARLFRSVSDLERLVMKIPATDGTHSMDITRQQIEEHYGGPLSRFAGMDAWRDEFLPANDTKEARAAFASKFMTVE